MKVGDWVIPVDNPLHDVGRVININPVYTYIEGFIRGEHHPKIQITREKAEARLIVVTKEVADILISIQKEEK